MQAPLSLVLAVALLAPAGSLGAAVPSKDGMTCPPSHPIKAIVTPRTKECVYQRPEDPYYGTMRAEMCFRSEEDSRREDCWQAKEVL
jgi:hypothetical protein